MTGLRKLALVVFFIGLAVPAARPVHCAPVSAPCGMSARCCCGDAAVSRCCSLTAGQPIQFLSALTAPAPVSLAAVVTRSPLPAHPSTAHERVDTPHFAAVASAPGGGWPSRAPPAA